MIIQGEQLAAAVAENLAFVWKLYQGGAFPAYLWRAYEAGLFPAHLKEWISAVSDHPPTFERLYIGESVSGSIAPPAAGSVLNQWWEVDSSGMRVIDHVPRFNRTGYLCFATPFIQFYIEGTQVAINEIYGPRLMFGRTGTLVCTENALRIDSVLQH